MLGWIQTTLEAFTAQRLHILLSQITAEAYKTGMDAGYADLTGGVYTDDNPDMDIDAIEAIGIRTHALSEKTIADAKGELAFNAEKLYKELDAAIKGGMSEKEALFKIQDRVQTLFKDSFPDWKLERLVRDQTLVATKEGRRDAWEKKNVQYRQWQMHEDSHTGDDSKRMNGQIAKIDEPYIDPKTGEQYMIAHMRPNDRCYDVPLFELPETYKKKGIMYAKSTSVDFTKGGVGSGIKGHTTPKKLNTKQKNVLAMYHAELKRLEDAYNQRVKDGKIPKSTLDRQFKTRKATLKKNAIRIIDEEQAKKRAKAKARRDARKGTPTPKPTPTPTPKPAVKKPTSTTGKKPLTEEEKKARRKARRLARKAKKEAEKGGPERKTIEEVKETKPKKNIEKSSTELRQSFLEAIDAHEMKIKSLKQESEQLVKEAWDVSGKASTLYRKHQELLQSGPEFAEEAKQTLEAYEKINGTLPDIEKRINQTRKEIRQGQEQSRKILLETCGMGNGSKPQYRVRSLDNLSSRAQKASTKCVDEGMEFLGGLLPPILRVNLPKTQVNIIAQSRGYNRAGTLYIPFTGTRNERRITTVIHEFGHTLEGKNRAVKKSAGKFLDRRTKGERAVPLSLVTGNRAYDNSEIAKKDHFMDAYCGKIYPGGVTELVSMGLQYLYADPKGFAQKDPDMFEWILDTLKEGAKE